MGLLNLKMTPQIEAYQDDMVGWKPQNENQAQDYYTIINFMKRLPKHMQPQTDDDIMQFMKAYGESMSDYSGYIPQPQNVRQYNQTQDIQGNTDGEIFDELVKRVGPAMNRGLLKGY